MQFDNRFLRTDLAIIQIIHRQVPKVTNEHSDDFQVSEIQTHPSMYQK